MNRYGQPLAEAIDLLVAEVAEMIRAVREHLTSAADLTAGGRMTEARTELDAARRVVGELSAMPRTAPPAESLPPDGSADGTPDRPAVFTHREWQVALLVCEGLTNRQIAGRMRITEKTVEMYLSRVFRKLDVANRVGLARALWRGSPERAA